MRLVSALIVLALVFTLFAPVAAAPAPFTVDGKAGVLMDARSGQVLVNVNGDQPIVPASLAKVMTMRLAMQALKDGRVKPGDPVRVSRNAWYQAVGGSGMFLQVDTQVPFGELLKGIAIVSGNDACVAVAEHLGGSVDGFVAMMNEEAKKLGLASARFVDPHGLSPDNRISPLDMVRLARAYVNDFPDALQLHSTTSYTYNGITQYNRNGLLGTFQGADGLKTGYIDEAGYNLVATAKRNEMRLIAGVFGVPGKSEAEGSARREAEAAKLLTYGFARFATVEVLKGRESFGPIPVYKGAAREVRAAVGGPLVLTVARGLEGKIAQAPALPRQLTAPVNKGQRLGELVLSAEGNELARVPLLAQEEIGRGGFFRVLWDSIRLFFRGLFRRG